MRNCSQTSQRLTSPDGGAESISSREVSPASLFPLQDNEKDRMTTVTSGRKCYGLYARSNPVGLLVRMLVESYQWYSPARRLKWQMNCLSSERITEKEWCYGRNMSSKPSVRILNVKDTASSRFLFRLVPSERPTGGTGCGSSQKGILLPTPMASDATVGAVIGKDDMFLATGSGMPRKINRNGKNGSLGLARMTGLMCTPTASDWKGGSTRSRKEYQESSLRSQVHAYYGTGRTSQLNPRFVAEMMGFPPEWTELPFQSGDKNPSKPTGMR